MLYPVELKTLFILGAADANDSIWQTLITVIVEKGIPVPRGDD